MIREAHSYGFNELVQHLFVKEVPVVGHDRFLMQCKSCFLYMALLGLKEKQLKKPYSFCKGSFN